MHLLSSFDEFYKKTKDEISARGEELHKEINQTVEKLHRELDGVRKEPETVLEKEKKVFEKMIEKIDEMNREVTKLQKSHDVKKKCRHSYQKLRNINHQASSFSIRFRNFTEEK